MITWLGPRRKSWKRLLFQRAARAPAYGSDNWSKRAEAKLAEIFETPVAAFLVATGTGANALALGALTPPWGAIFCHEEAHVIDDECGAPELFSAGAKMVGVPGYGSKLTVHSLEETLQRYPTGQIKTVQPALISISQATEAGLVYSPREVAELGALAKPRGLLLHMDGARFANALVSSGATPAEMTWKAGVDALSFGATKNGAIACEAVVFFDPERAKTFGFQRKRGGHLLSKGRFLGAQMEAYLNGGLWLRLAAQANASAAKLAAGLAATPKFRLAFPLPSQRSLRHRPDAQIRSGAQGRRAVLRLDDAGARGWGTAGGGGIAGAVGLLVRNARTRKSRNSCGPTRQA